MHLIFDGAPLDRKVWFTVSVQPYSDEAEPTAAGVALKLAAITAGTLFLVAPVSGWSCVGHARHKNILYHNIGMVL